MRAGDSNLSQTVLTSHVPASVAALRRRLASVPAPALVASAQPTKTAPLPATVHDSDTVSTVIEVVVNHTGYPADFVELDQDLEGELGIDTVKQAEIMAEIRERFGLPVDEDFVLADYPTLNHMIGYIQRMAGDSPSVSPPPSEPAPNPPATPVAAPPLALPLGPRPPARVPRACAARL